MDLFPHFLKRIIRCPTRHQTMEKDLDDQFLVSEAQILKSFVLDELCHALIHCACGWKLDHRDCSLVVPNCQCDRKSENDVEPYI